MNAVSTAGMRLHGAQLHEIDPARASNLALGMRVMDIDCRAKATQHPPCP